MDSNLGRKNNGSWWTSWAIVVTGCFFKTNEGAFSNGHDFVIQEGGIRDAGDSSTELGRNC